MASCVLVCGRMFDGVADRLTGPVEILVDNGRIAEIGQSVRRPTGAQTIDLLQRTVSPGFIDCHVHLTMDAGDLARQTLASSATKALTGLNIAREYMRYGFTTLRDLGCVDPDFPTVDLRNALAAGLVEGPRLIVAAHIISSSAGHGDLRGFYGPRWDIPVSAIADDAGAIKALVRREHAFGSDWIKTTNTGGYFSPGDDPARVTWFDDEMNLLAATARQLGMPVAVHTGAADGCRQAIRAGVRSLEHAYLIDADALALAKDAGTYLVPTMQMTREDLHALHAHTLPGGLEIQPRQRFDHRLAAADRTKRRKNRLRHRLWHVPIQPRHSRIPGDGGGGPHARPCTESRDQRGGRTARPKRYRRARGRQTRRPRGHAR